MSRNQTFFDPIILPDGRQLVMLRDAAQYITKFPKTEHDAPEWQAAMQALLLVAEHNGPTDFARIGVMRALNRHVERVFNPDRKDHYWRRRETARLAYEFSLKGLAPAGWLVRSRLGDGKEKPTTRFPARASDGCDGANMPVICPTCQIISRPSSRPSNWPMRPRRRDRRALGGVFRGCQ